ncbi:hypothetical protein [Aquidulcibacter sp.]|uniref:hypothetical protein n=1 Tax=Aquidulcibacter sp. TaxID=2052990 RepID=UPI0025B8F2F3|nr:hypothetical protein [Aquidulcibacter sp.]MCA3692611.1 hypothetical protein [Aquidulcibacter sp.]
MKAYKEKLLAIVEELQAKEQASSLRKASEINNDVDQRPPLEQQIDNLMQSLPPVVRFRPWTIQELRLRLNGRFKRYPSAGDIGIVLQSLGWTRRRDWTNAGRGRRIWIPK